MSSLHDLRRLQQIYAYFKRNNGEHLPEGCTRIDLIDYNDNSDTEENNSNIIIKNKDEGNINNWFVQFMYEDYNNSDFFVTLRISFSECTHSIDKSPHTKGNKESSNYNSSAAANTNNLLTPLSFMPMVFIISPRLHAPFIHHGTLCALEFMSRQWQLTTENISLFLLSLHHSLNPFTEDSKVFIEEEEVMQNRNDTATSTRSMTTMRYIKRHKNYHVNDDNNNYTIDNRQSRRDRRSNNFTENCLCNHNDDNNSNNNNNYNIYSANFISSYSSREHKYGMEHIRRCHPHLWRSYFHTIDIDCANKETNTIISSNNNDEKEKNNNNNIREEVVTSLAKNDELGEHEEYTITTLSQLHLIMEEVESSNVHFLRLFIDTRALIKEYLQKNEYNTKHCVNTLQCAEENSRQIILYVYLPSRLQRELNVEIMAKANYTDDDTSNISCKQEEQHKLLETSSRAQVEKKYTNQIMLSFTNDVEREKTTSDYCIIVPQLHLHLHNVFVRNHFIVDGKMTCASCTLQGTLIVEHHAQVSCTNTTIQVAMLCEPMLQEMEKHNINSKTDTNKREHCQNKISNKGHEHKCKEPILLLDHAELELIDNSNINLHEDCNYYYCYNNSNSSSDTEVSSNYHYHLNALVAVYNCAKLRIVRSEINVKITTQTCKQPKKEKDYGFADIHLDSVIRAEQSASIDLVSSTIRTDLFVPDTAESLSKFSVIMLQSASAYLHNVHILGSHVNNINEEQKIAECSKVKDKCEKRTMSMVQTRGISAEYGAHVVLEHVWVEHFHFGVVLLEHCRAYCTHCLITNTETGCVAHSALVEFDSCSIRETTNVAILLLKSSKCVVHDKERSCLEAQKYYSHRFYKALRMNIGKIESRQNRNELKGERNILLQKQQESEEEVLLTNTEILPENVNKGINIDCIPDSDREKRMFTFVYNVYESKESVVFVHHSTFIAHDVDFTSIHHTNISATVESVIELERCVMYKTQCPNVEDNTANKVTRAKIVFEEDDSLHCNSSSKKSYINSKCKYRKSTTITQKEDISSDDNFIHDDDDDDDDVRYCEEEEPYRNDDYETDISESKSGVYISQSSITMQECSVLYYYCAINLSHRSSATFCKCGAFANYIGFSVCHHSHAILTHCGTHHIIHTGVKLMDGSHVTMNGTAHDVTLKMNAQKEAVKLIEHLPSLEPCQPRTLSSQSHKESHHHHHHHHYCCFYYNHEQQTIYCAIYTGRVQAIECHNSILRAHGVCIWVGQSSGVNAHGWSSNDHDTKIYYRNDDDDVNNHDNEKRLRDAKLLAYNTESVNSITLEKCLIEQPTRCTVCRHEHTDSIHKLLETARHTCKCHVKHTKNVKNNNMNDSDNNENTISNCTLSSRYYLLPPGVAIKMWSGVHGRLTECEVRHAPIGSLLIGPTTQVEMHTCTFRHCTMAISVDGSLCKLHKCTSADVQHTLHLSSSARAIIRRGFFHAHVGGIRACDSSTLFLFGEVYIYGFTQFGLQAESGSHIENDSSFNSNSKISIIPCSECRQYSHGNDIKRTNKQIARQGAFSDNTSIINSDEKTKANDDRDNIGCEVKCDIGSQRFDNRSTWCVRVSTGGSIYLQNSIIGTTFKNERQFRKSKNAENKYTKSYDAQRKRHNKHIYTHHVNGVHADTFGCLTLCHCIIQCSTIENYLAHHHTKGVNDTVCENAEENKTFDESENTLPLQSGLELYQPVCVRVCNKGNVLLMSCVVWDNFSGMAMSVSNHGVCRVDGKVQMHNELQENTLTNTSLIRGVCFVKESECTIKHTVIQPLCLACTFTANNMASGKLQSASTNKENITQSSLEEQIKENSHYNCFSITSGAQCVIEHCKLDLHIIERHHNDFMQSSKVWNNLLSIFTVNGGNRTTLSIHHMTIVSNTKTLNSTSQEELEMKIKLICASDGAHVTMHHVDTNNSMCAILLTLHLSSSCVLSTCEKSLLSLISLHEKQKQKQQQQEQEQLLCNEETKSEECNALRTKVDSNALLPSPTMPLHVNVIFCNHATVYIKSHSDFINNSCNHKLERKSNGLCLYSMLKKERYSTQCKQVSAAQLLNENNAIITLTEHSVLESDIDLSSLICHALLVYDVDSTNTTHYINNTHIEENYALVHQVQRVWEEIIYICRKQLTKYKQEIRNVYCKTTALLYHVHVNCKENNNIEIQNYDATEKLSMNEEELEIEHCQRQEHNEFKLLQRDTNQRSGSVVTKVLLTGTAITLLLYSIVRLSSRAAGEFSFVQL